MCCQCLDFSRSWSCQMATTVTNDDTNIKKPATRNHFHSCSTKRVFKYKSTCLNDKVSVKQSPVVCLWFLFLYFSFPKHKSLLWPLLPAKWWWVSKFSKICIQSRLFSLHKFERHCRPQTTDYIEIGWASMYKILKFNQSNF